MDKLTDQRGSDPKASLRTYLRDHVAGAQHAVELLKALKELHAGKPTELFASEMLQQVEEDLAILKHVAASAGADNFELKEIAGWLGDKLSRLKLAPLGELFNRFEALEFLCLGILGKRALWKALSSIASKHPELANVEFATLVERAEAQYAAAENMRLEAAAQALGGEVRAVDAAAG